MLFHPGSPSFSITLLVRDFIEKAGLVCFEFPSAGIRADLPFPDERSSH